MKDIVKGVVYDHGKVVHDGETRYKYLVAMVVCSTSQLNDFNSDFIIMGDTNNITDSINELDHYKLPYNLGDISSALIDVSRMTPEYLQSVSSECD